MKAKNHKRIIGVFLMAAVMVLSSLLLDCTSNHGQMYPDFAIFRYDGSMIIWEHFGLMDNKDYFMKSYMKIEKYRRAGYKTHSNLICTYEEDMMSEDILTDIIERYLL